MSEAHCYENSFHPFLTFRFARIFFFKFSLQPDIKLLVSEMHKDWVTETKHVENCPDFEKKMAHVVQHGIQRFKIKNIKGQSTVANSLKHILHNWVCCINNSNSANIFTQLNPSRGI